MSQQDALLIIGNGYDLSSGLNSRFSDFFEVIYKPTTFYKEFKDLTQRINTYAEYSGLFKKHEDSDFIQNINIWDIYFMLLSSKTADLETWTDVETAIYNSLNIRNIKGEMINKTIWEIALDFMQKDLKKSFIRDISYEYQIIAAYMRFFESKTNYANLLKSGNLYKHLLEELQEFELKFAFYIDKLRRNDKYKNRAATLMKEINDLNSDRRIVSVLNFNYTKPFVDNFPGIGELITENVHGQITDDIKNVIIGIDSSSILYDDPGYIFTKTSRKLEMNISNNRFKTKHILDKKTKYIIFYGHSLGKQDYAYFQSIFDFFDLYHENITLEFIYSYYPSKEDFEIQNEQLRLVSKLIETYGNSHLNTHQGKNLLHKMIIEGRIFIVRI